MILSKITGRTIQITKLVGLALFVSFSFSCSPKDGIDGKDGATGAPGNANVFISDWLQIKFDTINDDEDSGMMIIPVEGLEDLVNNGSVILMYFKIAVDDQFIVYQLPYDDTFLFAIVNLDTIGKGLAFAANTSDVSELENTPDFMIQYVIIPKSKLATTSADYSKMTYEELMDTLN